MEKVEKAGTHVIFDNKEVAAWIIHTHPQLKNKASAILFNGLKAMQGKIGVNNFNF